MSAFFRRLSTDPPPLPLKVDHREGLLALSQLEESWMQSQLSLSGLIQQHMTRLSRPGHFLQVGLRGIPYEACF